MKKLFLFLIFNLITNLSFSQDIVKKTNLKHNDSGLYKSTSDCQNKKDIKIKLFQIDQGWGFDILVNNKKQIHQTNIPAINENKPFKTKIDAIKIAELMRSKMCKNIFPPSVTLQEIDSLITKK